VFFIALVAIGPIAAWRCHPASDEGAIIIGALAGAGATLTLFTLAGLISVVFALIAVMVGGEGSSPWPASVHGAALACIGAAAGGGAASFVLRALADWVEKW
jgi:hypothetical protein